MLKYYSTDFNPKQLKSFFSSGSKSIYASFFHKFNSKNDLKGKKLTVIDFEFSTKYSIFEVAIFDVIDGIISNIYFKEYQLPLGETYFDINRGHPIKVTNSFNQGKSQFTDKEKIYILSRMENTDYLVSHNYIAEMQCYMKLKFPNAKYDSNKIDIFKNNKIICTRYSFHQKYFTKLPDYKNGTVSDFFNWKVKITESKDSLNFNILNNGLDILETTQVSKDIFNKKTASYHNALFDIFVTYTNLRSLIYML